MNNWLSLFDGMSCLQIAAKEIGISPDKYYASEIDKHAIKQTQLNFPNTIQLGSVTEWKMWDIDWAKITLIGAGSPCQGFSFAGKQLAFDDPRSVLFFVFIDILNHCRKFNPNVKFLLENVDMKREHMNVINNYCGLFAVNINSNRVSAQNRNRWYWSNIRTKQVGLFGETHTDIPQPKDRGILLKDILEKEVPEKYYLSDKMKKYVTDEKRVKKKFTAISGEKSISLMANYFNSSNGTFCVDCNGKISKDKTGTLTSSYYKGNETNGSRPFIKTNKQFKKSPDQKKASCFTAGGNSGGNHSDMDIMVFETHIRRLTPTECARLQTIPEWYKWACSDTQQYRMLGNGWTIKIIMHILSYL